MTRKVDPEASRFSLIEASAIFAIGCVLAKSRERPERMNVPAAEALRELLGSHGLGATDRKKFLDCAANIEQALDEAASEVKPGASGYKEADEEAAKSSGPTFNLAEVAVLVGIMVTVTRLMHGREATDRPPAVDRAIDGMERVLNLCGLTDDQRLMLVELMFDTRDILDAQETDIAGMEAQARALKN